ncbi:MAG: polysaccharide deacetylase family protein [Paludibacter sp.]|nr:polysaccharide deacetylase family protein [Paludibacter sp.]
MDKKQIIITTSWDDGYALDIRIAELLDKYNMKGTFYVPIRNNENPVMNATLLNDIANKYEIGGHTVNHIYLNTLGKSEANYEISECKNILQNQLGKQIDAFCYPGGKYSQRDINLVKEAGFLFGRTTRLLHTSLDLHPYLMDTSIQAYNHSSSVLTAHCLKNTFLFPIVQNYFFYKGNKNFAKLTEILMSRIMTTGGLFHLWGHSWEIEKYGLWKEFEMVLEMLAFQQEIAYLTNTECWKILSNK